MIVQLDYGFAAWAEGSSLVTLYSPDGRARGTLTRQDVEALYAEREKMPGAQATPARKII